MAARGGAYMAKVKKKLNQVSDPGSLWPSCFLTAAYLFYEEKKRGVGGKFINDEPR